MEKVSAHESIEEMHEKVESDGMTNVHDRFEAMEGVRCPYCEKVTRCNICSNGPCRIIPNKTERGVCGIDKDGMVMRNILRINSMRTPAYTYHAKTAAKTLKETGKGNTIFEITDEEKLKKLAGKLDFDTTLNNDELAIKLVISCLKR